MTGNELGGIAWRKSSHSGENGNCVEVGWPRAGVALRDSKQGDGPRLAFDIADWRVFVGTIVS